MTRPDTPPTPAPAQDVTARAAEVLREHRDWTAKLDEETGRVWTECRKCGWPGHYQTEHLARALAAAGLLARDLPTRDEIAAAIRDEIKRYPIDRHPTFSGTPLGATEHTIADAVEALLRGESRGE